MGVANKKTMKKYLLFCYDRYYPSTAFGQFKGSFDTVEDCAGFWRKQDDYDYLQIVLKDTFELILTNDIG